MLPGLGSSLSQAGIPDLQLCLHYYFLEFGDWPAAFDELDQFFCRQLAHFQCGLYDGSERRVENIGGDRVGKTYESYLLRDLPLHFPQLAERSGAEPV